MTTGVASVTTAPATPALISLRGLRHAYGRRQVLQDFSVDLMAGETLGLLGKNGSGKSTALALLAGIEGAQGGAMTLAGQALPLGSPRFLERVGVIFQSPSLDPRLSCLENLALAARLRSLPRAARPTLIREALEIAGLSGRGADRVDTLSGGLRRRLDLARALMHDPEILLLDEPTTGLDEASFRATWERLEAVQAARGISILVATHRPDEAERCDRVAIVDGGRVVAVDPPEVFKSRLADDLLVLESADPEALVAHLRSSLGLAAERKGKSVTLSCEAGHQLIPRIVESLPAGTLRSVSLRRPTMADVFASVTGDSLDSDASPMEEAA